MQIVGRDEVLPPVHQRLAIVPRQGFAGQEAIHLGPAYGAAALSLSLAVRTRPTGDEDRRVGRMVDVVVFDAIVAALPGPDAGRVPEQTADVMHMAVGDGVVAVDVLGSQAIPGEQDARPAKVRQLAPRHGDPLAMQVEPHTGRPAVDEPAVLDPARLGPAEPQHGRRAVEHLPVMLQAPTRLLRFPRPTIGLREGQAAKHHTSHRRVARTIVVDLAFDTDQLGQSRRNHVDARLLPVRRPEIELAGRGVQDPLAGFIQRLQHVFDPNRPVGEVGEIGRPQRIGRRHRRAHQARRAVHLGHRQDIHGPRMNGHHHHLRLGKIRDALHRVRRQVKMLLVNRMPTGGRDLELPEAPRAGPRQHRVGLKQRAKRRPVARHVGHPHVAARRFRQTGQSLRRGLPSAR